MLSIMIQNPDTSLILERARQLAQWLEDEAPYVQFDQRHLDAGTPEQAYWHLGYAAALRDVLALLTDDGGDRPDRYNRSPSAGRGA